MKKEENIMITKFKTLFEKNIDLTDISVKVGNEKKELIDKIKHELSIITYKKSNSPKSIRILDISGYFNKRDFRDIKLIRTIQEAVALFMYKRYNIEDFELLNKEINDLKKITNLN